MWNLNFNPVNETGEVKMMDETNRETPPSKFWSIGYQSDTGRVRTQDEDSLAIVDVSTMYRSQDQRRMLMIVADGMGGYAKGDVASRLIVETVTREVSPVLLEAVDNYESQLQASLLNANDVILEYVATHPTDRGMGATVSVAVIDGRHLYIGHVGDTRVYVIRDQIIQVTTDHSTVQQLLDRGVITPEQARTHPRKNEITRALGIRPHVEVDTHSLLLETGEYVLLCCDGLINEVRDAEIDSLVRQSMTAQQACNKLVDLANERGGRDNISIILAGPFQFTSPHG
jgi:protein phosphatase